MDKLLLAFWVVVLLMIAGLSLITDIETDMALLLVAIAFSGLVFRNWDSKKEARLHKDTVKALRDIAEALRERRS